MMNKMFQGKGFSCKNCCSVFGKNFLVERIFKTYVVHCKMLADELYNAYFVNFNREFFF